MPKLGKEGCEKWKMHSGSGSIALKQSSAVSVYIGIASLVLEGRIISTDEDDEDAFSRKFEQIPNPLQFQDDNETAGSSAMASSTSRHAGINRISEKLMLLRQFPGSTEIVDTSISIPLNSSDDGEYERQPRLHNLASAREFQRNTRLVATSSNSSSNSSSAASVLHDIDADWNDISIVFNGLDSLISLPGSPIKIAGHSFRSKIGHHPLPMHQEVTRKEKVGKTKPQQGPHCEKFLKKIGIIRSDSAEADCDHMCNHISGYCRRWQFHLRKMLQLLSKGEDACIEVYLGPENNAILLEQWTFKLTDNPSPSTMTIQALCNAIRSQLGFSQVSSWVDLLKKAFVDGDASIKEKMPHLFSPEIMQNPRLKKNLETMKVDLDILFRIKTFDGTSCFNDKPNVHNFPDTMVSDRMALQVCLNSLPRLEKIPTLNTEKANINGLQCDNRIKSSPVAGSSSCHLMHDRMSFPSCHETGKHHCEADDEEDFEVYDTMQPKKTTTTATSTVGKSARPTPTPSTSSALSHRERQLLKYKRLLKRDKQKKKAQDGDQVSVSSLNTSGSEEFGETAVSINDTFAPLYGTTANTNVKRLSIATQTDPEDKEAKCTSCGDDLQCRNCDKTQINFNKPTAVNIGSVRGTMIGNKADLLLQAIQRTADAHHAVARDKETDNIFTSSISHLGDSSAATQSTVTTDESRDCDTNNDNNNYLIHNNNNLENDSETTGAHLEGDCRLCKRQKTRHNYTTSMGISSNSSGGSYRRTMSECLVGMNLEEGDDGVDGAMSYTPLPIHVCDDTELNYADESLAYGGLKAYRRAFSDDVINQLPAETCCFESNGDEPIVGKCSHRPAGKVSSSLKLTPIVTLQQARPVSSMSPHKKLVVNQKIPKINLTQLFDDILPNDDSGIVQDTSPTSDTIFTFSSPARSYPPTMMQLSPRQAANSILKRRSRHMSDRSSISEYSNFSDEEEDVLKVTIEPSSEQRPVPSTPSSSSSKISSLYKKFVTKTHAAFNKLPLLGTIEESLLRDRFQPKAIVSGFKVLLGASGSFCPTQLTIPAQTFFYEFKGLKHISTPYVCEFRLSRKGYSIPRAGTVQATLLNPQGTVVRMFFVPYDFRDMPAMSQTFIRQRVLAIDEHVSQKEAENMSTVEQMKHLRYVVHLKFQTGRSGRLCLHTDIKLLVSRRTEFDTAQAHAKNSLESPNDLKTVTITPDHPKFSSRIDKT